MTTCTAFSSKVALATRPSLATNRRNISMRSRSHLYKVRATAAPEESDSQNSTSMLAQFKERSSVLVRKYDFVSAGLGALMVTAFCVSRGQDPFTALSITAASTVVALLINDTMEN